ncbi:hypothetical protein [Magnetovibrio blakemorei]|uniref:Uncharacterized protein n=1 Tax=Magnetovibrio blakemorei TaxID=28181 RepID=A0A1E5Q3U4_9PROT|nr:hypothetical protein [Magnetovibrio blakemorei]OEJ64559.1 hypothetical protein BEN30_16150 [Magnetovibrio blakemorei]
MARMNWDKIRKEAQMKRYGHEPVAWSAGEELPYTGKPVDVKSKPHEKQKPKKKVKRVCTLTDRVFLYLHDVVRCDLIGVEIPPIPKEIEVPLESLIASKGGVLEWAKTHPKYEKIRKRKEKKLLKKHGEVAPHTLNQHYIEGIKDDPVTAYNNKMQEYRSEQEVWREKILDAEKTIALATDHINSLDKRIAKLEKLADPAFTLRENSTYEDI